MKKQKQSNFKEVQNAWYQKLKEEGFEDIEDYEVEGRPLKVWHCSLVQTRYSPESFERKQDYYCTASKFLYDYRFKSKTEKRIWELHCEGISMREIGEAVDFNKDKVNAIIRNLVKVMRGFLER